MNLPSHTHRSLIVRILALLAAVLVFTGTGWAQGTFGALPDPISSRDLDRYAERLGLSDQQTLAFADAHSAYLEQFRELREREIESFLDAIRGLRRGFDFGNRREVENLIRSLNGIMGRIRTLDEGLFDRLQPMLTPEQDEMLPRIRMARERERFGGEITRYMDFINPGVRVDLSEFFYGGMMGPAFSPEAMEIADPILQAYEMRLTAGARKLFDTTTSMALDVLKRLERMGFTEGSMRDRGMALQLFQAFESIWDEVTADMMREAEALADLHRRTYRSLASTLPEEDARRLRREYFRRAYPEAAGIGRMAERQLSAALRIDELPEDTRQSIEALQQSHRMSQDRIADQIVNLLDERRKSLSLRTIIRRGADERQQMLDDLRRRADEADASTLDSLRAMLGPELAQHVQRIPAEEFRGRMAGAAVMAPPGGRGGGEPGVVVVRQTDGPAVVVSGAEASLPPRITITDARRYAGRLGLDEDQWVIFESLYADYSDQHRAIREEQIDPISDAIREAFGRRASQSAQPAPEPEAIDRLYEMRRQAFDSLREAERSFLEDVAIAVVRPEQAAELARIRGERDRIGYLSGIRGPGAARFTAGAGPAFGGGTNEAGIDLTRLIHEVEIAAAQRNAVLDILDGYAERATSLMKSRYEAETAMRQVIERFGPMRMGEQSQEAMMERARETGQIMQTHGRASREAAESLAELNRSTLSELSDRLPESDAFALRRAYQLQAYPDVFNDPGAAESRLIAVFELDDLSEQQRSRMMEMAAEYRRAYAQITEQMIDIHAAGGGGALQPGRQGGPGARGAGNPAQGRGQDARGQRTPGGQIGGATGRGGGEERQTREDHRNSLERLRFERTELNQRMLRQLRAVLTPDQIEQIGGLDSPGERAGNFSRREWR